ncbi:hypothetical protein [Streptomyces sp. TLI_171]|uniref:hypothetical protein n=1 Tax=Streptomyces sp. TLI_171 TaxID=1938859 RepID=UPI000C41CF8C|nr:hypothetical protein [Streptomyces sp. TLI_171]RKE17658.1 hypothetical protein BX266_0920 [Streptomyces sp. TLI_171]
MSAHVDQDLALRARVLLAGSEPPTPWQAYRAHRLLARVNPAVHLPRLALAAVELTKHYPVVLRRDIQLRLMEEALAVASAIDPADPDRPRALAAIRRAYRERAEQLGIEPAEPGI